ncbi:MAG: 6-carboxytetrahydropterin synthase [Bacteroidota bacterium]|jgi:6-pyruvoyltetrahydropterin/6-carboxytetrahydropterin synthase|nr:6-carboxytetrahydropterin synthase [Bacteroidota bacterium]
MMYVTRREHFSSSHRLFNPEWSEERNARVFGKCNNPAGHGHNYYVEITVAGEVDPETGYVVDLKELKEVILARVIAQVDHRNLNTDVDFLRGVIPTAENIAIGIWTQLVDHIPRGRLHRVRLYETEKNFVDYRGEA